MSFVPLLALWLLAAPQVQPAAAPLDFAAAKQLADADEASVTGPSHATLLAAQAALLDAGVAACSSTHQRGDTTAFTVVMQLDAHGQVQRSWRQGDSPLAICLQHYVRGQTLFVPPKAPFHAALEISFAQ